MESIILFNIENDEEIKKLAGNMHIKLIYAGAQDADRCINEIAASGSVHDKCSSTENLGSMMVFCEVSEKHLERMLFGLRQRGVKNILKAVLTPSNGKWTPVQLYEELSREHAMMNMRRS